MDFNKIFSHRWTEEEAFEYCQKIACGHYENFPVGSLLIPKQQRPHVYNIYAFARAADDFADEGSLTKEERLISLYEWQNFLKEAIQGKARHPIFIALSNTIKKYQLPPQLFIDLLDAFLLDVSRSRHQTFQDLLDYSKCSANPIGRLLLLLFGYKEESIHKLSDAICTALQLTNFWQDILIDLEKDRLYLPLDYLKRFRYNEEDLRQRLYTIHYIEMMKELADQTEALFLSGYPLCNRISGRFGFELKLIWFGGMEILDNLRKNQFNIFDFRPTIGAGKKIKILLKSLYTLVNYSV